jgi:hypothetical protein
MRWCVALLLFVVTGAAASAQTLPTAEAIRARSDATYGLRPENVRDTIRSTGTLGETVTVTYKRGPDMRETFDRGGIHSEFGTEHGEAWRQNPNGLTTVDNPAEGKETSEQFTTSVSHVTTPVDAYVVTRLGTRQSGTRTFYDPVTYRIVRLENRSPLGTTVETFDTFAQFGTVTRATHWTISSPSAGVEQQYERTGFDIGVVNEADVHEPPTRRMLVEFPPGVTDVALPVRFVNNAIILRVTFGRRGVDFALDSGASGILIDSDLARELGLPLTNATSTVTARRYTSYQTIVPDITIGQLHMHDITVHTGPVNFQPDPGSQQRGLMGFDFLAQLGVTIDYEHKTVHVTPSDDYVPPVGPETHEIAVRLGSGVPMATVTVGTAIAESMMFDTGCQCSLTFFDYFTRRYPAVFRDNIGSSRMNGIGGSFVVDHFRFPEVEIGNAVRFLNFSGVRAPAGSYEFNGDGLVGSTLLSLFTVGLDYTHGHIYLTLNDRGKSGLKN